MTEAHVHAGSGLSTAEDGKLGRALRLGALVHAFYWHGSQASLTRSSVDWGQAFAALEEVTALLDRSSDPAADVRATWLRSVWAIVDSQFVSLRYATMVSAFNFGWHCRRYGNRTGIELDLVAAREDFLRGFVRPELLYHCIFLGLDDGERGAFELGVVIDRGGRPPCIHRRLPVPAWEGWFSPRNYIGSCRFRPGELPPDESWPRELASRWQAVLGEPLDLERHIQAIGGSTDGPSERCALVAHLLELARLASVRVAGQGNRPSTSAASVQPVAESDSIPAAPDLNPFPLQFEDGVATDLKIINSRGAVATFNGQAMPFKLAKCVYERTINGQPASPQELHREMWPEAPAGKDFKNSLNRLGRVDRVSLGRLS